VIAICTELPDPNTSGHFPEGLVLGDMYRLKIIAAEGNWFVGIFELNGELLEVTTPRWSSKCFGATLLTLLKHRALAHRKV